MNNASIYVAFWIFMSVFIFSVSRCVILENQNQYMFEKIKIEQKCVEK